NAFNLTKYSRKNDVIKAISQLKHGEGVYTDTSVGIKHMDEVQMSNNLVRTGMVKVGLIITDGKSQDFGKTKMVADAAMDHKILMFAVGVGNSVNDRDLLNIAGHPGRVFKVKSYNDLTLITKSLACMSK
ncbi:unnamed protein product, partial [Lymnaea stagnalis]